MTRHERRPSRPTQADIARLAGVSQPTVSLVLGGNKAGVALSDETRQRVLDAAESLGYVPDPIARRLSRRTNNLLGLYTFTATFPTDVQHSYYPFLVGVEEEAAAQGYDLLLFTSSGAYEGATDVLNRVRLADGCLFLGRHVPEKAMGRFLDDGYPLVYIGRHDELGERLPYVGADYVSASADVVRRLAELGHRHLAYVREKDDAPASADREAGLRSAVADTGVRADVVRTDGGDVDTARLRSWLADGVTAIVAEETDTDIAVTAVESAARAGGLRCPDDFSLALLGDRVGRSPGLPALSGFAIPRREMGRAAVRMLTGLIAGEPEARIRQILGCHPLAGETVGAPPRPPEH
ncbi:LacI family DNA-binding transcriptional regulator [Actinocatenispora rupis]|uniref:LacI family transcriptional regulator n=1 Tax=Actinocatenispora rupis TaxID=519421 RepID=A0A8J3NG56_9ACTN|nr:LacI family DNA-binding transcriptional regulator [Actinocatenispora rupis]GID15605.1 LacI family transcriptional regulator [Actinocatenispora rupis]